MNKGVPAALAALGALALVVPANAQVKALIDGPPVQVSPASQVDATPAEAVLDEQEKADAVTHVAADSALKRLIGDAQYKVGASGPWTTNGSKRQIGAFLELELADSSMTIDGDWPSIQYDAAEDKPVPYTSYTANLKATKVTKLIVLYDADLKQIVSIQPTPAAEITLGPYESRRPSPEQEGY